MRTTARSSWMGRVVMTAVVAVATTTPTAAGESGPMDVAGLAHERTVEVVPHTQREYERRMIVWARGLFEEADLDLPHVDIRFSTYVEDCEGSQGTLRTAADGTRIIRICADHDKPSVRDTWRRRALVHELAHLWEQTNLDDDTRREFMGFRKLEHWNDRSDAWFRRATEHAAEIITWGLIDFRWLFVALPDNSCHDMLRGFGILTGREPVHGRDFNCSD